MLDIHNRVKSLKRPTTLVRAARFGVRDYKRGPALRRLLNMPHQPSPAEALVNLLELEEELEAKRTGPFGDYIARDHVDVIIAIAGEARHLQERRAQSSHECLR